MIINNHNDDICNSSRYVEVIRNNNNKCIYINIYSKNYDTGNQIIVIKIIIINDDYEEKFE